MYRFNLKSKLFFLLSTLVVSSNVIVAYELEEITTQLVLTGGEEISGKHFKCEGQDPYQAVIVTGDNVSITNSLFTGCYGSIIIAGAKNTLIKGNRFEDVGLGIRERRNASRESSKGTEVSYNEFRGVGVKDCRMAPEWIDGPYRGGMGYWACDVYIANAQASRGKVLHNLVDNRGKKTPYIEDLINIGDGSYDYEVKDNTIIGSSEEDSSSSTAACIIVDTEGSNFTISGNSCYNAATSGIANAGGKNFLAENNLVYITKKHALVTSQHAALKGKQRMVGDTSALSTSTYASRECGINTRFSSNRVYAYYVDFGTGELRDTGTTHNFEDSWGLCRSRTVEENNQLNKVDPQWEIPKDLFSDLPYPYFSMKKGVLGVSVIVDEDPVVVDINESSESIDENLSVNAFVEETSEESQTSVKVADKPLINQVGVGSYVFILVSIFLSLIAGWFSLRRLRV